MQKHLLIAVVLLPLLRAGAAPEQNPSFDPSTEAFGFSSDELGGGSYLGVDTRDVTPDRVSALKLKDESGVEVTMVDRDAPAGKAGIREHDVILTLNGSKVESVEQLRRMIREVPAGRLVNVGISRDGQPQTLQVQLADRSKFLARSGRLPKTFKVEIPPMPPMPAMPEFDVPVSVVVVHSSTRSGLMVENLTPQLGEFFGAKEGHGVLVRSVEKGSRAEKAGFHAGDVIVRVEGDAVHDSSDFSHALRSHNGGKVSVSIIREKKEQTLTLPLPERRQSGEILDEESFEFPEIDIEANLDSVNAAVSALKPQMALAAREMKRAAVQLKKQLCDQQRELQKQQKELQEEMLDQQIELQDQVDEHEFEVQRELLHLQRGPSEI